MITARQELALLAEGQKARRDGVAAADCPYRAGFMAGDQDDRLRAVTWLRGYYFRSPADDS